ncbi:mechanosensitive ion channel MscS [Gloeomargarita lithophora Alchichica-D10]|uniref:Mechanosensitive ion channel MscS n=1 Tax=Gloeomargarita lithophora Alchichica-D10 TaxID=1188229 RepID=A0A1J0AA86_9CYAN|nr:mechanosensitive ion channel family protein [Gloeomargarita lithophora]APB32856.1 mechanosensitive ion channel MscS [Gloeomargarita lithophora Alchichica-D10]
MKWQRWFIAFSLMLTLVLAPTVWGQTPSPTPTLPDTIPVVFDGQELFRIPPGNILTAQERANLITSRLEQVAQDETVPILIIQEDKKNQTNLRVGAQVVVTISNEDADTLGVSRSELAGKYEKTIAKALADYRSTRSPQKIIRGAIYAALATVGWFIFYELMVLLFGRTVRRLENKSEQDFPRLSLFNFDLFSPTRTKQLVLRILRRTHLVLGLAGLYFYLAFVFKQFVWTERFGVNLLIYVQETLAVTWQGLVNYLPNLINIAVTAIIVYYTLAFLQFIANRMEAGELRIPGFYQDWIKPTFRLMAFFTIALAFMIIIPFLPGFQSPAFQGVSIFIGLVISLGSTETVTNIVAGIILIYSRAFQLGNIVKIRETMGMVEEKSLLITRIRTPRNEVITLPNSMVLNSSITNFSTTSVHSPERPLFLNTTVTLGYDTPWQKIYQALTTAALRTKGILADPAPFVWQTALNDFPVSYNLNAATDQPQLIPFIYSDLHQHIQDCCNEVGIEIMSPGFMAVRDGNHTTIPEGHLPKDYQAPGMRISPLSRLFSNRSEH